VDSSLLAHSILAPSSAGIWGKEDGCTGYVLMSQMYPETEPNQDSLDGEASHEIGEFIINEARQGRTVSDAGLLGLTAENGVEFTEEMIDGARLYAEDVINVMRTTGIFGNGLLVEKRLKMPQIHEVMFGTTDCVIYDGSRGEIWIWDYKFGYEIVEPYMNYQAISYLAGVINHFNIDGITDQNIKVHVRIAQPRAFHRKGPIREWSFTLSDIRGDINILTKNAAIALSDDATTRTGPHCRHCEARHSCEAALNAGARLFEICTKPTPLDMSHKALGLNLVLIKRAIKQLRALETGFEQQIESLVKAGNDVPYWLLESGKGRETWCKPPAEVTQLCDALEIESRKEIESLKTPNQIRQEMKKSNIDESVIKGYSHKPNTGLKLVEDNGDKAKMFFGE
jgi:hypothetical protein